MFEKYKSLTGVVSSQADGGFSPVLDLLSSCKSGRVLEVGSGVGKHAEEMRGLGHEVVCVDWNSVDFNVLKADMHELPFIDECFDFVTCSQTLEHSLAPVVVLCEISRVLKKGGKLFLVLPDYTDSWVFTGGHVLVPTPLQVKRLVQLAGMKIEKEMNAGSSSTLYVVVKNV